MAAANNVMLNDNTKTTIHEPLLHFDLPPYKVVPDVGLYLEQVTKYVSELLLPLAGVSLTGSMISNYVKHKIIPSPIRKQYSRDQIVLLLFIGVTKTVISLEDIQLILRTQSELVSLETFYEHFRTCLKSSLHKACCDADADELQISSSSSDVSPVSEKSIFLPDPAPSPDTIAEYRLLLRRIILTAANSIYLKRYLTELRRSLH